MKYKTKLTALVVFISTIIPLMAGNCGGTSPPPAKKDFSLTASSVTITQGQKGTSAITITRTGGLTELVNLVLNGLPAGVTATFNPQAADTTSVLTLDLDLTAAEGNYTLTLTGTAGTKTHNSPPFTLTIKKKEDNGAFELTATAVTITKDQLQPQTLPSANSTIGIARKNSFAGAIHLTAEELPAGVIASFNPNDTNGDSSILKLMVTSNAPKGSHNITVKGTSGAKSATTVFSLTIKEKNDTIKPKILSLSPTSNQRGVNENAKIVIKFSEAMDKQSAQDAFKSTDIGPVTFSWVNAGKTMIVKPNNKLKYSSNTFYKFYHYGIMPTAKDLAGNPLVSGMTIGFSTYRTFYKQLISQKEIDGYIRSDTHIYKHKKYIRVGDGQLNKYRRGFLSFDITSLPSNTYKIKKAIVKAYQNNVYGTPYTDLRGCYGSPYCEFRYLRIYHMNIAGSLDASDFNRAPISTTSLSFSTTKKEEWKTTDVTKWVQDDFVHRVARNNRSQYRLQFYKNVSSDGSSDSVRFMSADNQTLKPYLKIWYYLP